MFDWKAIVVLSCLLASSAWATKKDKGDGVIRVVMRGPPLPVLMQGLTSLLMNHYMQSLPMSGPPGNMHSRSDYGRNYGGQGGYAGGGYMAGGHGSGGVYYYNPKRTGYSLGLGLGALKGLLIGTGSGPFNKIGGHGYGGYSGHSYGGYKSSAPKFNIHDGLMLLKGLLRGPTASKLGTYAGHKPETSHGEARPAAGGLTTFLKSFANDHRGHGGGNSGGGFGHSYIG